MPTTVPSKNDLDKLLAEDARLRDIDAAILLRLGAIEQRLDALEAPAPIQPPPPAPTPEPVPTPAPTPVPNPPVVIPSGNHGYFEALRGLWSHVASYSLRDPAQLVGPRAGGYASGNCPPVIIYDPVMDAAKAAIKPFQQAGICEGHHLTQPMSATDTVLTMSVVSSTYGPPGQRQLMIGEEILELRSLTIEEGGDGVRAYDAVRKRVGVVRGQYGTTPAAHAVGDLVLVSGNQIGQMLHLPVGTQDGRTVITWDGYWTDSYVGLGAWNAGQKTFQLTDAGNSKLLEIKLAFQGAPAGSVGNVYVRAYETPYSGTDVWGQTNGNTLGPGTTGSDRLGPQMQAFTVYPGRWVRFWAVIDQAPNDWDRFSLYVGDAVQGVVQVYDRLAFSIERKNPPTRVPTISKFWWELGDSSTEYARGALVDLTSYLRNVVAHRSDPVLEIEGLA